MNSIARASSKVIFSKLISQSDISSPRDQPRGSTTSFPPRFVYRLLGFAVAVGMSGAVASCASGGSTTDESTDNFGGTGGSEAGTNRDGDVGGTAGSGGVGGDIDTGGSGGAGGDTGGSGGVGGDIVTGGSSGSGGDSDTGGSGGDSDAGGAGGEGDDDGRGGSDAGDDTGDDGDSDTDEDANTDVPTDTSTSCEPAEIECNDQCCNTSTEECVAGKCVCITGTFCTGGMVCNASHECVPGCIIDGSVVELDESPPSNECKICSASNATDWTNVVAGTPCMHDGGSICDGVGECVRLPVISLGDSHSCALTPTGKAKCWGLGTYGRIGDNATTNRLVPVQVSGIDSDATSIGAGGTHSCAVTSGGQAKCWGYNNYGQLGDASTTNGLVPQPVLGLNSNILAVAVGGYHACALTSAGSVKCWGRNNYGQIGDGTSGTSATKYAPTQVDGLESGIVAITAGNYHTCALTSAGAALCWGYNSSYRLGDNTTTTRTTPTAVSGLSSGVKAISAGDSHTCAINSVGGVECWGSGTYGRLGDGTTTSNRVPAPVSGLTSGIIAISAGYGHTCAIDSDRTIWCWGYNNYGQLGNNTTVQSTVPTLVYGTIPPAFAVSTGQYHSCALLSSGGAMCWGRNNYGQHGDNTTNGHTSPAPVIDYP